MKNIAIFCSANNLEEKYIKPAKEIAHLLSQHGYHLVWGGADVGLMKVVSSAVKINGSRLIGVSIPIFEDFIREDADEIIVAKTLSERKTIMLDRSDAIIALVGGFGTLDEITEIIELKKQKYHDKPIVILNTENFYEGLKILLQKMERDGFISNIDELIYFADTPQEVFDYIKKILIR